MYYYYYVLYNPVYYRSAEKQSQKPISKTTASQAGNALFRAPIDPIPSHSIISSNWKDVTSPLPSLPQFCLKAIFVSPRAPSLREIGCVYKLVVPPGTQC